MINVSNVASEISIVIPLDTGDSSWRTLLNELKLNQQFKEIVISAMEDKPTDWLSFVSEFQKPLIWLVNPIRGRAAQLNNGAGKASGKYIWFVHADSQIHPESFARLNEALKNQPGSLIYFDLKFSPTTFLMKANELGAKIRSSLFKLPFGDQGLCISRHLFYEVGRYNEKMIVGEDLEFVVNCTRRNIKLYPIGIWIKTSPRKYEKNGWLSTTIEHLYLTFTLKSRVWKTDRIAIAVFVKTPGFSPVKTRLAKARGKEFAENFYKHSVLCIKDLLVDLKVHHPEIDAYWAIAEDLHLVSEHWPDFFKIAQGNGDLGQRLNQVYGSLLKNYKSVILIGSDSPHLSVAPIDTAIRKLATSDFSIGRAHDGGFYLLAGQKEIEEKIWNSVPYSQENTSEKLVEFLSTDFKVTELEKNFDIDEEEDLEKLKTYFASQVTLTESQKNLAVFLNK